MRRTHRLLLPWRLARLGARASKAPRLSVRHREAVGAVVRRPAPCLQTAQRAWIQPLGVVQVASDATMAAGDLAQ